MSIKIHHGPDGTFKTSGAIKNDILPVIKSGRTLVTNIRGFSKEKCIKVLGRKQVHKDFKVIFVDTDLSEGRAKMARFFHWVPVGSYIVIDEIQRVIRPKWTERDLKDLDYPGGETQADKDDRPENIHTAFDMQRHYNWDFVFTTTSIKKVHPLIAQMAKIAVRHVNMGIWRFYKTIEHSADNTGMAQSNRELQRTFEYVPTKIFALYASTKTGSHTNTEPRTAIWKNPQVVGMVFLLVVFWIYIFSKPAPTAIWGVTSETEQIQDNTGSSETVYSDIDETPRYSVDVNNPNNYKLDSKVYGFAADSELKLPFNLSDLHLTGVLKVVSDRTDYEYFFDGRVHKDKRSFALTNADLEQFGYKVFYVNDCFVTIRYKTLTKNIFCKLNESREAEARSNGTAAPARRLSDSVEFF